MPIEQKSIEGLFGVVDEDGDFLFEPFSDASCIVVVRLFQTSQEAQIYADTIFSCCDLSSSKTTPIDSEKFARLRDQLEIADAQDSDNTFRVDLSVIQPNEWPKTLEILWSPGLVQ